MSALLVVYLSATGVLTHTEYRVAAHQCVTSATKIRQRVRAGRVKVFCDNRRI